MSAVTNEVFSTSSLCRPLRKKTYYVSKFPRLQVYLFHQAEPPISDQPCHPIPFIWFINVIFCMFLKKLVSEFWNLLSEFNNICNKYCCKKLLEKLDHCIIDSKYL